MDKSDNGNPFKTINQNDSKLYNTLMISSKETICRKIDTRIFFRNLKIWVNIDLTIRS